AYGGSGGSASGAGRSAGNGGTASSAAAATSGSGTASASSTSHAGVGGVGYSGANGGHGGSVTLSNTATGTSTGTLRFYQTAVGGAGGYSYTAQGGNGGAASSTLNVTNNQPSVFSAALTATAGQGGNFGVGGSGGSGGAATVSSAVNNTKADAQLTLTGTAQGGTGYGAGNGGNATLSLNGKSAIYSSVSGTATAGAGGSSGSAGDASSTVTARNTAGDGYVRATSHATALGDGTAQSEAVSLGYSAVSMESNATATSANLGSSQATATSTGTSSISGHNIVAQAVANGNAVVSSRASSTFNNTQGLNFPNLSGGSNGLQAFSFANGATGVPTLTSILSTRPNLNAAMAGMSPLGFGSLGANYGSGSTGTRTFTASANLNFSLATTSSMTLGLLGMTGYGGGFDSLTFTVSRGATTLVNSTFSTFAAAQTYFTDAPISLGTVAAGPTNLLISYSLTASSAKGADMAWLLAIRPTSPVAPVHAARLARPVFGIGGSPLKLAAATVQASQSPMALAGLAKPAAPRVSMTGLRPTLGSAVLARGIAAVPVADAANGADDKAEGRLGHGKAMTGLQAQAPGIGLVRGMDRR
ncbi:MAG: hypothetical protein WA086_00510, partial [Ideonella sp.]